MTRWRRSFNRAFLPRKSNEEAKVVGSNELLPSPLLESLFVTILGEPLRFRFVLEEVPRATDPTFPRSRNSRQSRPTLPSWLTALNSWTQDVSAPEQPPFVSPPLPLKIRETTTVTFPPRRLLYSLTLSRPIFQEGCRGYLCYVSCEKLHRAWRMAVAKLPSPE